MIVCNRSILAGSSSRHSIAIAPWPTCGTISSKLRICSTASVSSRRCNAANAITAASISSRSTAATRVAMFPRKPTKLRSGRRCASCERRRAEPVATVAPCASRPRLAPISASRASPLFRKPARLSPAVGDDIKSFALCTATSALPSSTALWTSFTKTP